MKILAKLTAGIISFLGLCSGQSALPLLGVGGAGATISRPAMITSSYIQNQNGTSTTSSNLPLAATAGYKILGHLWAYTTSLPITSLSTSGGDTCTTVAGSSIATSTFTQVDFYCPIATGGSSFNVTVNLTASSAYTAIWIGEYGGIADGNPVDVSGSGSGSNASTISLSSTMTPTANGDLIFAGGIIYGSGGYQWTPAGNLNTRFPGGLTSMTTINVAPLTGIAEEYQPSAAGISTVWTTNQTGAYGVSAVAFKTKPWSSLQPVVVGATAYLSSAALSTHVSHALTITNSSGLLLFIGSHNPWLSQTITVNSVVDSAGNTWNLIAGPTVFTGATHPLLALVYYCTPTNFTTNDTITISLSNPAPLVMWVGALGAATGYSAISAINSPASGQTSTAVSSGPISTTANNLLVQFTKNELSEEAGPPTTSGFNSDYTLDSWDVSGTDDTFNIWTSWQFQPTSGSYSGNYTYTTTTGWQSAIIGIHK